MDYEHRTGKTFSISQASTGKLYAQIIHGAPYDIFFSADSRRPALLVRQGLAYEPAVYAQGQLMLITRKGPGDLCNEDIDQVLLKKRFKKLAIANPKTAPYGIAAEQFINAHGKWNELSRQLVRGENVLQAFHFVTSGNADAGLIAKSLLIDFQNSRRYCQWQVPRQLYQPVKQEMVVLKSTKKRQLVQSFYDYMKSADAKAIIKKSGYFVE
ncbi:MAG: molybdate ABC transporter substrate-binding protein [Gammaproteobacteria bacterium]|nr:molybdate ABC transporter substrate-binding protein [Gammaproteobacteria bacterium]